MWYSARGGGGGKSSPTKFMPLLEGAKIERKKMGKRKNEIEA